MEPIDEETTPVNLPMAYCPATAKEDCPAGDMRCAGGTCRKLREQELAAKQATDDALAAGREDWIERSRATAAERAKAAEVGKGVCPACGDWLPLDLTEFRCMGKGHHVAVARDSVFPPKVPKLTPKVPLDPDREFRRALQNAIVSVVVVVVLLIVLGALFRRAPAPPGDAPPPARMGAS